jgi:hypothetical protein
MLILSSGHPPPLSLSLFFFLSFSLTFSLSLALSLSLSLVPERCVIFVIVVCQGQALGVLFVRREVSRLKQAVRHLEDEQQQLHGI